MHQRCIEAKYSAIKQAGQAAGPFWSGCVIFQTHSDWNKRILISIFIAVFSLSVSIFLCNNLAVISVHLSWLEFFVSPQLDVDVAPNLCVFHSTNIHREVDADPIFWSETQ